MGGDRKGDHTERNGEPNWERVLDDIFGEAIFDAVSVVLESQNKGWKADTSEV